MTPVFLKVKNTELNVVLHPSEFTYLISAVRGEILDLLPLPTQLAQESTAESALASSYPAAIQAV